MATSSGAQERSVQSDGGGFAWMPDGNGGWYREPVDERAVYEGRDMVAAIRTISEDDWVHIDGQWVEVSESDENGFSGDSDGEGTERRVHLIDSSYGLSSPSNTACVRDGSGDFVCLIDSMEVDWS